MTAIVIRTTGIISLELYLSRYKSHASNGIILSLLIVYQFQLNVSSAHLLRSKYRFTGQIIAVIRIRGQYPAIVFRTRKSSVAFHRVYPSCITLDMAAADCCLSAIFSSNARDGWLGCLYREDRCYFSSEGFHLYGVYTENTYCQSWPKAHSLARASSFIL